MPLSQVDSIDTPTFQATPLVCKETKSECSYFEKPLASGRTRRRARLSTLAQLWPAAGSPGPQPHQVRRRNLANWAPNPWRPAQRRGHLTHRRTRQDHQRPQFLLEAGQQQAAQATALGHRVRASRPGSRLLRELHVAFVLPGARTHAARGPTGRADSSLRPPPPPQARPALAG